MRRSRLLAAALAALTSLLLLAPLARAEQPDSLAPPGAAPTWLPKDQWVMERWMPFDQKRLLRILGINNSQVYAALWRGDLTLEEVARRRGVPVHGLATRLLANRRAKVSRKMYRVLFRRTRIMLTQGHLAEHVIGHVFHHTSLVTAAPAEFGVAPMQYVHFHQGGLTPVEIAAKGGRSPAQLRASLLSVAKAYGRRGVRRKALSAPQARARLNQLKAHVDAWMAGSARGVAWETTVNPDKVAAQQGTARAAPPLVDSYCPLDDGAAVTAR